MLPVQGAQGSMCGGGRSEQEEEGVRESGEGSLEEDKDSGVGGSEFIFKRCDSGQTRHQPAAHSQVAGDPSYLACDLYDA